MELDRRNAILISICVTFGLIDLLALADRREMLPNLAILLFIATIPVQFALVSLWAVFGAATLPSRVVGGLLFGSLLALALFRVHYGQFALSAGLASALFAVSVAGSHLALGVLGFWIGQRFLGLRLVHGYQNMPVQTAVRWQFSLRELLIWRAGTAVLALAARYAVEGCRWTVESIRRHDLLEPAILLGIVAFFSSPLAMLVLGFDEFMEPRWHLWALCFVLVSLAESLLIGLLNDWEYFFCGCCGFGFLNAFQCLPVAFCFWLVCLSGYRLAHVSRIPAP